MARQNDDLMNGVVGGLLIVLIVVAVWFYFQFQNYNPLSDLGQFVQQLLNSLEQLGQKFSDAAQNASTNLLSPGSTDGPVSTIGVGGGPGSVIAPQIITGSTSSEAAALQATDGWVD